MASKPAQVQHRVVSLLPSATEILCAIGGQKLLIGRSHEDNFPSSVTSLPILTGQVVSKEWTDAGAVDAIVSESIKSGRSLYTIDENQIRSLKPNFILTQHLCKVCAIDMKAVECLTNSMLPKPEIVSLNPHSLQEVLEDMTRLGSILNLESQAAYATNKLEFRIRKAIDYVAKFNNNTTNHIHQPKNVAFIEWSDPVYVGGHWTPQLIRMAGGIHPLNPNGEGAEGLYVQTGGAGKSFPVPIEAIIKSDPDIVIICPCGLSLKESRREADRIIKPLVSTNNNTNATEYWFHHLRAYKNQQVYIVDGDAMFNRPGPRLVDALEWLLRIIHNIDIHTYMKYVSTQNHENSLLAPTTSDSETLATECLLDIETAAQAFAYENYFNNNHNVSSQFNSNSTANNSAINMNTITYMNSLITPPSIFSSLKAETTTPQQIPTQQHIITSNNNNLMAMTDIEDIHHHACQMGQSTYIDPITGFTVFTEIAHLKRGKCCGNKCRHCPFGHYNVQPLLRSKQINQPTLLRATSTPKSFLVPRSNNNKLKKNNNNCQELVVVFWSGGKDSLLALLNIENNVLSSSLLNSSSTATNSNNTTNTNSANNINMENKKIVLFTHFNAENGHLDHQNISIQDVMDQAKALGHDLYLLPLPHQTDNNEYCRLVKNGLIHLYDLYNPQGLKTSNINNINTNSSSTSGVNSINTLPIETDYTPEIEKKITLVFGDLHLQDIKKWREQSFYPFSCVFPLFNMPYDNLLKQLWNLSTTATSAKANTVADTVNRGLIESIKISAWNGKVKNITINNNEGKDETVMGKEGINFNEQFLAQLPGYIDRMGENGEFHTHVVLKSRCI